MPVTQGFLHPNTRKNVACRGPRNAPWAKLSRPCGAGSVPVPGCHPERRFAKRTAVEGPLYFAALSSSCALARFRFHSAQPNIIDHEDIEDTESSRFRQCFLGDLTASVVILSRTTIP